MVVHANRASTVTNKTAEASNAGKVNDAEVITPSEDVYVDPDTGTVTVSKLCSRCGYTKPLRFFYKKTRGRFGRQEWCKRCMANKPPMSAEAEMAEQMGVQGGAGETGETDEMARKGSSAVEAPVTNVTEEATGMSAAAPHDEAVTAPTALVSATQAETQADGRTTFGQWLRITGSAIFATPDFAVLRVQGTSTFTIHLSANIGDRVRALTNYIPAGAIPPTMIELVARVISDSLFSEEDILGYAYY